MSTSLAARLDAMKALATVAQAGLPVGINSLYVTEEGVLGIAESPRPSMHRFTLDGLQFHVSLEPEEKVTRWQIRAEVGHVPYSAESAPRRSNVLEILRASRSLRRVRFVVEQGQKIHLVGNSRVENNMTPETLMYETVLFVHEARPYLRLLAAHLHQAER